MMTKYKNPKVIAFTAKLVVNNVGQLLEEYANQFDRVVPVPVALLHISTQLAERPEKVGIRIISKKLDKESENEYLLTVEAEINNRERFYQAALAVAYENWDYTEDFVDVSDSKWLSELILSSNPNGSPDQLGYDIATVCDAQPSVPENSRCDEMAP